MSLKKFIYVLLVVLGLTNLLFLANSQTVNERFSPIFKNLRKHYSALTSKSVIIENIKVDSKKESIKIVMPKEFLALPFREDNVQNLYDSIKAVLPDSLLEYDLSIECNNREIGQYIPNYYRIKDDIDKSRINKVYKGIPLITFDNKPYVISNGLQGKHLAVWNSHGRYYDPQKDCWQWQRPRLYGITEDTYTGSIVIPYLLPMLENAGAITFMPRERDIQIKEIIVDNDISSSSNYEVKNSTKSTWESDSIGFANIKSTYKNSDNPFELGTYQKTKIRKNGQASINWIPDIPSAGEYGVYISYKTIDESVTDAHYTVYHSGGSTSFSINQTMGGGTWIYLGKFKFKKGRNYDCGRVELTNKGKSHGIVTADAVRFGGGIGNIARSRTDTASETKCSGYPRFLEGARYWLQWAGYPDSIYNINKGKNEYNDDYMSRAQWVNNLLGGSLRSEDTRGKHIPLDAVLALHTDAGVSKNDNIIGSLGIYMTSNNSNFINGTSRIASRDLCDLVQTQTVDDINAVYNCNWTRRKITDASYYEARVPEVPSILFEFLSHQNFQDMKYGLDPVFRFTVARSIYKGFLKYLSTNDGTKYTVQPLPVSNFSVEFYNEQKDKAYLSWKPVKDPLEPTADPTQYILYTSKNNNGFDNGILINENQAIVDIKEDTIYNFKITAVNAGGESFPSEILSIANAKDSKGTVLIINGFDRVSGPANFNSKEYEGMLYDLDPGVPYKNDISFTGNQYDFKKSSEFVDNENPGIGASYSNYETAIIAGNTFNYPNIHGNALLANGYSFSSCSTKAFEEENFNTSNILFIDLIFGAQKEVQRGDQSYYHVYNKDLTEKLDKYLKSHGNIFVSGAYIASDVFAKDECDSTIINFIENKLHYTWGNAHMLPSGSLTSKVNANLLFANTYEYFNEPNRFRYAVTAPDAIEPVNGGETVIRYSNTKDASCVIYNGQDYKTIVSAIPFETIKTPKKRTEFMKDVASFFQNQKGTIQMKMLTLPAKSSVSGKGYSSTKKSYKQDYNKK